MDIIFLIYLSKSIDSLRKENVMLCICCCVKENDSIIGSLQDHLNVY